jgi:hypothetical protein
MVGVGVTLAELDSWLDPLLETRVGSFDLEQPTAAKLVMISKLVATAATCLPLGALRISSSERVFLKSVLNHLIFAMSFHLLLLTAVAESNRKDPAIWKEL